MLDSVPRIHRSISVPEPHCWDPLLLAPPQPNTSTRDTRCLGAKKRQSSVRHPPRSSIPLFISPPRPRLVSTSASLWIFHRSFLLPPFLSFILFSSSCLSFHLLPRPGLGLLITVYRSPLLPANYRCCFLLLRHPTLTPEQRLSSLSALLQTAFQVAGFYYLRNRETG